MDDRDECRVKVREICASGTTWCWWRYTHTHTHTHTHIYIYIYIMITCECLYNIFYFEWYGFSLVTVLLFILIKQSELKLLILTLTFILFSCGNYRVASINPAIARNSVHGTMKPCYKFTTVLFVFSSSNLAVIPSDIKCSIASLAGCSRFPIVNRRAFLPLFLGWSW